MTLQSIGLLLDIFGVIIIFIFGISPSISKGGETFIISGETNAREKKKWMIFKVMSYLGLIMLLLGFLFQLIYAMK